MTNSCLFIFVFLSVYLDPIIDLVVHLCFCTFMNGEDNNNTNRVRSFLIFIIDRLAFVFRACMGQMELTESIFLPYLFLGCTLYRVHCMLYSYGCKISSHYFVPSHCLPHFLHPRTSYYFLRLLTQHHLSLLSMYVLQTDLVTSCVLIFLWFNPSQFLNSSHDFLFFSDIPQIQRIILI